MTSISSSSVKKAEDHNNHLKFDSPKINHTLPSNMRQSGQQQYQQQFRPIQNRFPQQMTAGHPGNSHPTIEAPEGTNLVHHGLHGDVHQYSMNVGTQGQPFFATATYNNPGYAVQQIQPGASYGGQTAYMGNPQQVLVRQHPPGQFTATGPGPAYRPPTSQQSYFISTIPPSTNAAVYPGGAQFYHQQQYVPQMPPAMHHPQMIRTSVPPPTMTSNISRTPSTTPGMDSQRPTQQPVVQNMMPVDPPAGTLPPQVAQPRRRNIIAITDPKTGKVTNLDEINKSENTIESESIDDSKPDTELPQESIAVELATVETIVSEDNETVAESVHPETPTPPSAQLNEARKSPSPVEPTPAPPGDPGVATPNKAAEAFMHQFASQLQSQEKHKKICEGVSFGDFGSSAGNSPAKQPDDPVPNIVNVTSEPKLPSEPIVAPPTIVVPPVVNEIKEVKEVKEVIPEVKEIVKEVKQVIKVKEQEVIKPKEPQPSPKFWENDPAPPRRDSTPTPVVVMPPTVPVVPIPKLVTNGNIPQADVVEDVMDTRSIVSTLSTAVEPETPEEPQTPEPPKDKVAHITARLSHIVEKSPETWSPTNTQGVRAYDKTFMDLIREITTHLEREPAQAATVRAAGKGDALQFVYVKPEERGKEGPVPVDQFRGGGGVGRAGGHFDMGWQAQSHGGGGGHGGGGQRDRHMKVPYGGRTSSGRGGGRGRGGGQPQQHVINRSSVQAEVKLNQSENAYKPREQANLDDKEKHAKAVRGILNKITPQTINELSGDFLNLGITDEKEVETINIIFDKCVEEPVFCNIYSQLVRILVDKQKKEANGKSTFLGKLLEISQKEFEREEVTRNETEELEKKLASATEEDEKKKLEKELTMYVAMEKRRMLGIMKFIGELYKLGLLVASVMNYCVVRLLREGYNQKTKKTDEESLEALCKLLTTMGKKFEDDPMRLGATQTTPGDPARERMEHFFRFLETFTQNTWRKENNVQFSSRLIFMIKDLIDLRQNKWVPRRQEAGPKKIDQIHNDAKLEKMQETEKTEQYEQNRQNRGAGGRPSHGGGNMGGGRNSQGGGNRPKGLPNRNSMEMRGENVRTKDASRLQQAMNVNAKGSSTKSLNTATLRGHVSTTNVSLGGQRGKWGAGASGGNSSASNQPEATFQPAAILSRNRFKGGEPSPKPSPGSSRDSSQTREKTEEQKAAIAQTKALVKSHSQPAQAADSAQTECKPLIDEEKITKTSKTMLKQMAEAQSSGSDKAVREALEDGMYSLSLGIAQLDTYVKHLFDAAIQGGSSKPVMFDVIVDIFKNMSDSTDIPTASAVHAVTKGALDFVNYALEDDLEGDLPKLWHNFGVILGKLCSSGKFALSDFADLFKFADEQDISCKLNTELLAHTLITMKREPDCIDSASAIESYCGNAQRREKLMQLVSPGESTNTTNTSNHIQQGSVSTTGCETAEDQEKAARVYGDRILNDMFNRADVDPDKVFHEIETNTDMSYRKSSSFVSALTKKILSKVLEGGSSKCQFNEEAYVSLYLLFMKWVTTNEKLERVVLQQVLEELQELEFPQAACRDLINALAESNVICSESFLCWREDCLKRNQYGMFFREANMSRFFESIIEDKGKESQE